MPRGCLSSPAVSKGVLYFGSTDHYFYAVEIDTGKTLWKFQTGDQIFSAPKVSDGLIYFGSNDGNLYAIPEEE
jgi:outer membrane protein assembly factor BamB